MDTFGCHPKYGAYANSDLFGSVLRRALAAQKIGTHIRLDLALPDGLSIDASGFLHKVTMG